MQEIDFCNFDLVVSELKKMGKAFKKYGLAIGIRLIGENTYRLCQNRVDVLIIKPESSPKYLKLAYIYFRYFIESYNLKY